MTNLHHSLFIASFRRSNTLLFKTLVALEEPGIKFSHGRKSEDLKLVHFVLTPCIQSLAQLGRSIFIYHYEVLVHLRKKVPISLSSLNSPSTKYWGCFTIPSQFLHLVVQLIFLHDDDQNVAHQKRSLLLLENLHALSVETALI